MGSRGLLVLLATGLVGVGLAVHGYGHGTVLVAGTGGFRAPASVTASRASAPSQSTSPSSKPTASSSTAPSQSTSPSSKSTTSSSTAPSQKVGPLLASTQYAPYAFQVYPGPESSQTQLATTGFTIQVAPRAGTINLSVSVSGSGQGAQTATYPAGDRVYFIEATLGDDSGGTDYSLGDDGVIVTNAKGNIVQ